MALVGAGAVTIAALAAGVRSSRTTNKALVLVFWAGYMAFSHGFTL